MADPASARLFVTPAWLSEHLDDPAVVPIDASWYLPSENRDPAAEFATGHIPGAAFFDIDALSDPASGLPHMLPDAERFSADVGALGIPSTGTLVVYDGLGLFSAPRAWWTLKLFGAERVVILAGGLPRWRAEGRAIETGPSRRRPARFDGRQAPGAVATLADVRQALDAGSAQVVDARSAARFRGEAPEPRPGVRAGHMPGSLNLPFTTLVADGNLKEPAALQAAFTEAGVDLGRPIVTSCGSGVTAAVLMLALDALGHTDAQLYDGSWSEYGSRPDLPVATGA